ncbi:hypothetical protein BV25DRAFT_1827838 [Artomyces pyxidatus]|uniref:Uncharacterized protein n=1 Tax=Artomyces pyxidatus TaxID=48021 RepID=A0ACB8SX05_9AGAM|nr:hypothetical protein BV25DRAFT_1827838 [Artomyces pyxidatus]
MASSSTIPAAGGSTPQTVVSQTHIVQREQSRSSHRNKAAMRTRRAERSNGQKSVGPPNPSWQAVPATTLAINRRGRVETLQKLNTQLDLLDERKRQHREESTLLAELHARLDAHDKRLDEAARLVSAFPGTFDEVVQAAKLKASGTAGRGGSKKR